MTLEPGPLPQSRGIDILILSRLFDDTTNSYKLLFFEALLSTFRDSGFKRLEFTLRELAVGMVAKAWFPIRIFHLSLGSRDQVAAVIATMPEINDVFVPKHRLRDVISAALTDYQAIVRYVPYRVLTPFFADRLVGLADHVKNGRIRDLAAEEFAVSRPLYRFGSPETIELHPDWAEHLAQNYPIVAAWAEFHWVAYLQSRNPTVPAITEKAGPPATRRSLARQTRYWKSALAAFGEETQCIYSRQALDPNNFNLDHFLPWTFVCHDALWNLVPVVPEVNLSKGNRLPDPAYLTAMVRLQHRGLMAVSSIFSSQEWANVSSDFVGDLRISEAQIFDRDGFSRAYEQAVRPQIDIARNIGFVPNWRW